MAHHAFDVGGEVHVGGGGLARQHAQLLAKMIRPYFPWRPCVKSLVATIMKTRSGRARPKRASFPGDGAMSGIHGVLGLARSPGPARPAAV